MIGVTWRAVSAAELPHLDTWAANDGCAHRSLFAAMTKFPTLCASRDYSVFSMRTTQAINAAYLGYLIYFRQAGSPSRNEAFAKSTTCIAHHPACNRGIDSGPTA